MIGDDEGDGKKKERVREAAKLLRRGENSKWRIPNG